MYFKKKECPSCHYTHDEMLDYCPFCGARNESQQDFKRRHPMTFIPFYKEIILALLGFIGFDLISILFQLIFYNAYQANQVKGLMLINTATYILFFLICILILAPYFKDILNKFKIGWAYLFGMAGFIVLISFSTFYGMLTDILYPQGGTGGNQSSVTQMVLAYPVISIFIIGIIGPICEECAYRIGLFTLLRRVHPALAYVGTAFIFGIIHFDFSNPDLITELIYLGNYMFGGLTLSFVYEKKGLAASTTTHILNNMLSILMIVVSRNVA